MSLQLKSFCSTDSFIKELREDAKRAERFPVRIILVEGLGSWQKLVKRLQPEVDTVLRLSSFCGGEDTYPCGTSARHWLTERLREHSPSTILILPLAEWLRLEAGHEEQEAFELLVNLVQMEKVGDKRIYVPLLEAAEAVRRLEERVVRYHAQGELPPVWKIAGQGSVTVKVFPFVPKYDTSRVIQGIRAYLECWETGGAEQVVLVTKWAEWLKGCKATFTLEVLKNAYEVLAKRVASWPVDLREELGSKDDWFWLAQESRKGESFSHLAARLLNMKEYDSLGLMERWKGLEPRQRWLGWLWSKLEQAQTGYLGKVVTASTGVNDFERRLIWSVLEAWPTPKEAREKKSLLVNMGLEEIPRAFLEKVRELRDPLHRLACLTGFSEDDKELALLAVKELMESDASGDEWWEYLEVAYPELLWYLRVPPVTEVPEAQLQEYFWLYTRSRVRDEPDARLLELAQQIATDQILWKCRTRDQVLEELKCQGVMNILWVDGLGMEWLGVLLETLRTREDVSVTIEVARANLPTTTENNRGWDTEKAVVRTIDRDGHEVPYPWALIKQLSTVREVANRALSFLDTMEQVVITADHGLTRFAKTSGGIRLAGNVQVHKWGRCATVPSGFSLKPELQADCLLQGCTLILLTHEKFYGQSGTAYQVHGGATPEEWLVPVVRVRRIDRGYGVQAVRVLTPQVLFNVRGEGELRVELVGYKGKAVELRTSQYIFEGKQTPGGVWVFTFVV